MSLAEVTNLSQCFMEKALYIKGDVKLCRGEHIGVVGQNSVVISTLFREFNKDLADKVLQIGDYI